MSQNGPSSVHCRTAEPQIAIGRGFGDLSGADTAKGTTTDRNSRRNGAQAWPGWAERIQTQVDFRNKQGELI